MTSDIIIVKFLMARYSVDKLSEDNQYELTLILELTLDGVTTLFIILDRLPIPIPSYDNNDELVIPGDGSIEGFARIVGTSVSQSAIDLVLMKLGLKVNLS